MYGRRNFARRVRAEDNGPLARYPKKCFEGAPVSGGASNSHSDIAKRVYSIAAGEHYGSLNFIGSLNGGGRFDARNDCDDATLTVPKNIILFRRAAF
jgi:hypothetical protein